MILNRQRGVAVSLGSLGGFCRRVRQSLRLPEESLTVCLVSEARIARWNRAYRGKSGPTDVLSFPARPERRISPPSAGRRAERFVTAGSDGYLGDIAIAPAVARRNARRLGRTVDREMRILILHGALHLLGYDHETDDGEMNRIERRLRRRLGLARS